MKCKLCPNTIGVRFVTLIGPTPKDVFNICWECWGKTDTNGTGYHPSIHDDGPPERLMEGT